MSDTHPCPKCSGAGRIEFYAGILGGVCFRCKGRGRLTGKPPKPSIPFAVFAVERASGDRVRAYNVRASTPEKALAKAELIYEGASTAFKDDISMAGAVAIPWSELPDPTICRIPAEQKSVITQYYEDKARPGQPQPQPR